MKKLVVIPLAVVAILSIACGANSKQATPSGYTSPSTDVAEPSHGPYTAVGDGTFEVGVDMVAGTYKGVVPNDSIGCYLQVSKSASDKIADIIDNKVYNAGAKIAITVKDNQWLTVDGCGLLKKQ